MNFKYLSELIDNYDKLKYSLLNAQTFSQEHFGFPSIYYKIMETDQKRVGAFHKAFAKYDFSGKIICEAGVGTLALTKHYMDDVKYAYLIENNPEVRDFITEEISKNGWEDKAQVIFGDATKVELPEPVDFIVGELMSIYCANEYQVQIFKHLRKYLKPRGKLLPEFITNVVQLSHATFEEGHKHYPINFTRHLPEQLSLSQIVNVIDLYKVVDTNIEGSMKITPILSGKCNCIYMHSAVQVAEGCNFTGTDSLMPPTVCKLEAEVMVKKGEPVELNYSFAYGTSLDQAKFWISC